MDDLVAEFLTETNESLDAVDAQLVRFEQAPDDSRILDSVFRLVHTVKGTCGFLGLERLGRLAHAAETAMERLRDGAPVTAEAVSAILQAIDRLKLILAGLEAQGREPPGTDGEIIARLEHLAAQAPDASVAVPTDELEIAFREAPGPAELDIGPKSALMVAAEAVRAANGEPAAYPTENESAPSRTQSIRVNVDTLEALIATVGELVLTRNQLLDIMRRREHSDFAVALQRLANVTAELQEGVLKTRMQPIANAWQKLPRIVRDLARELGKEIRVEMAGGDTELDRQVLELVRDPLTHMVRNAADHGLEPPADRRAAGKPRSGRIRLSARHEGGHILIDVADDGRGLDPARIRAKALEMGIAGEAELAAMAEAQLLRLIFQPGFSTAETLTDVSGRGVGMDVVRANVEAAGGAIDVRSSPGQGTTFTVKLPLTLAIVSALIVEAAGQCFAVPQIAVLELVRIGGGGGHRLEALNGASVLRLGGRLVPVAPLRDVLALDDTGSGAPESSAGLVVVMQSGPHIFGVTVESVAHTEEIVVKPMSRLLRDIPVFSGTTILGDGSVIMVIDPNGIAHAVGAEAISGGDTPLDAEDESAAAETVEAVPLLVFRAGGPEPKVVPLSLVSRLEEVSVDRVEQAGGRNVMQYRGGLIPLLQPDGRTELPETPVLPVIVIGAEGRTMGLMIDEIIDVVEAPLDIRVGAARPGVLGSAVVGGAACEVIDAGYHLASAFDDWIAQAGTVAPAPGVLLVDDSAFFRDLLTPVLSAAGYRVIACPSAQAALERLDGGAVCDAVVTDLEMPGIDGFELAERLAADPRFKGVPVIAIATQASSAAISKAREAGVHDFVGKFDRPGLIAALGEAIAAVGEAA